MYPNSMYSRKPWIAVVLSLICTGLGHIYSGRIVKGLLLFLATLLFLPVAIGSALAKPSTAMWAILLCSYGTVLVLWIYAIIDSYIAARRVKGAYAPKDYNRGVVYFLFMLVGITNPFVTAAVVRMQVLEAFYVPAASMVPNVLKGDYILVNKMAFRYTLPERGDVVVFRSPPNRRQAYIKRVIGLPGDSVAVRGGEVFVNGKRLGREKGPDTAFSAIRNCPEGDLCYETNAGKTYAILDGKGASENDDYEAKTVPAGNCFVLGDNRDKSLDSRSFGYVPLGDIFGRVQYIYFPACSWSRFGAFEAYGPRLNEDVIP